LARLHETIIRGENKYCEFKSSLRLDIRNNIADKKIEHSAFKNIAAFLNSEGGTLIIGVDDEKNILGLEQTDYTTFSKPDKQDEWSKHLDNLIQNFVGNKVHAFLKTQHIGIEGKTVAIIEVKQSNEPVWLKNGATEEFYIRRTASAVPLSGKEAVEYIKAHWK
jgi:predicted HTH transcriptional regulator